MILTHLVLLKFFSGAGGLVLPPGTHSPYVHLGAWPSMHAMGEAFAPNSATVYVSPAHRATVEVMP